MEITLPGPSAPKSSMLTTRLPSHPQLQGDPWYFFWMGSSDIMFFTSLSVHTCLWVFQLRNFCDWLTIKFFSWNVKTVTFLSEAFFIYWYVDWLCKKIDLFCVNICCCVVTESCFSVARWGARIFRWNRRHVFRISRLLHVLPDVSGNAGPRHSVLLRKQQFLRRRILRLQPRLDDDLPRVVETQVGWAGVSLGHDKYGAVRGAEGRFLWRARERSRDRATSASVFGLSTSPEILRRVCSDDGAVPGRGVVCYVDVFPDGRPGEADGTGCRAIAWTLPQSDADYGLHSHGSCTECHLPAACGCSQQMG